MTTITEQIEHLGIAEFIGEFETGSPEWLQARKGISGTDIGAILGKSAWKSAYTLWAEKTGLISDTVNENIAMRLGKAFEDPIANIYAQEHPFQEVHKTGTWQSNAEPTWKANPDRIIKYAFGDLGVMEIKYTRNYWNDVPEAYKLQLQWYMHLLGIERGVVVAVTGGDYAEFEYEYDESLMRDVELDVKRFETHVAQNKAPEWDGSNSTYETVRAMSPGIEDGEVELGNLWINLSNAKANYDDADRVFNAFKSATLAAMQGTKIGTYDGERVIQLQARAGKPFITFK